MDATLKSENKTRRPFNIGLILMMIISISFILQFKQNNFHSENYLAYINKDSIITFNKKSEIKKPIKFQSANKNKITLGFNSPKTNITNTNKTNLVKKSILNIFSEKVNQKDIPNLADGLVIVTPNLEAYKIAGIEKNKETLINIPYDQSLIPVGYQLNDIRTYRYDESVKKWEELQKEGIDPEKNLLYSRTHADGVMINGIIKSPELPQTETYTPTKIKDLKLADPGAMVQLIEPPVANQKGSADLNYHIEIPKGRQGMQPDLNITYNSDATNGLLGEGWDMHIPVISVETRWGVPEYETSKETETYLLNGEMLAFETAKGTTTAHRDLNEQRKPDRQFYTRKQNNFNKIIRHGDKPNNYWWEVIDRNGTKFYYGRLKESKPHQSSKPYKYDLKEDANALLKDKIGNIAEWKITRVEDIFGNCIIYNYLPKPFVALDNINITNSYLNDVLYTCWEKEGSDKKFPANYKIEFKWIDNPNFNYSARYGFVTGNIKLLDVITIKQNAYIDNSAIPENPKIRSYKFDYNNKAPFAKTILTRITQLGTDETIFNQHNLKYFDDVATKGLFKPAEDWESNSDLYGELKIPSDIPNTSTTSLGGTKSIGTGYNFYAGFGINDRQLNNKILTAGAQFSFNNTQSKGLNTLIDIDGDGLPDKVFVEKEQLKYLKNSGSGFATEPTTIKGAYQFFQESSTTTSSGISGYFGISRSKDKSDTQTDISTYFSDVNADGLIDIINNKIVLFNKQVDNKTTFVENSNDTPVPITLGAINIIEFPQSYYDAKRDKIALENPMHDMVRVWIAPFDGTITIKSKVSQIIPKIATTQDSIKYSKNDGLIAVIQKNNEITPIWSKSIAKGDSAPYENEPIPMKIKKNERIFFRVISGIDKFSNSDYDKINWEQEINYTQDGTTNIKANRFDIFGGDLYHYKGRDEQFFSNEAGVILDSVRDVKIAMPFLKDQTISNDVKIEIIQLSEDKTNPVIVDGVHMEEECLMANGSLKKKKMYRYTEQKKLFETTVEAKTNYTSICNNNELELKLYNDCIYIFRVSSDVNTEFKKILWEPFIYFHNKKNNSTDTIYVVPSYSINNDWEQRGEFWQVKKPSTYIKPFLKFSKKSLATDTIQFTIREAKDIRKKHTLAYANGNLTATILDTLQLRVGDELYATFESENAFKEKGDIQGAYWIIQDFESFNGLIHGSGISNFTSPETGTYILNHNLKFISNQNQEVKYSLMHGSNLLAHGTIKYKGVDFGTASDTIQLAKGDKIYVNYENIQTPIGIQPNQLIKSNIITVSRMLSADVWYKRKDLKFGPMYRNWGQFAYNDIKNNNTIPEIDTKKLKLPEIDKKGYLDIRNKINNELSQGVSMETNLTGLNDLDKKKALFQSLLPYRDAYGYFWKGMDDDIYINAETQSTSRVGLKEISFESPFKSNTAKVGSTSGIIKRSESTNKSKNKTVVVAGDSESEGDYTIISDYMDTNGDRFPDVISTSEAQLTNSDGSLGTKKMPIIKHMSSNSADGNHIGGSSPISFSGNTATGNRQTTTAAKNNVGSVASSILAALSIGSASKTRGYDYTVSTMIDVNGDGLPDKLYKDGSFELNMVNRSHPITKHPSLDFAPYGYNRTGALNFGYNNGNSSVSGGMGASISRSLPEKMLLDINGDGVIDKVEIDGENIQLSINSGAEFHIMELKKILTESNSYLSDNKWKTAFNASAGHSFGGTYTYGIPLPFPAPPFPLVFKAEFSAGISKTKGLGTTLRQFTDIDGDGFVDYLFSDKPNVLQVRLSNIGKTNKLQSVSRPLGGSFEINYEHSEAKYEHPGGKWVMNSLTIKDGVPKDRTNTTVAFDSKQTFKYADGNYDRYEREFLGFEKVIINQLDYDDTTVLRKSIAIYDNKNYYTANNLLYDIIKNKDENTFVETEYQYYYLRDAIGDSNKPDEAVRHFFDGVYSCPLKYSVNKAYEESGTELILNESHYKYDSWNNNIQFRHSQQRNLASSVYGKYDYEMVKSYEPYNINTGIFGLMKEYSISDSIELLRKGKVTYYDSGKIKDEEINTSGNKWSKTKYEYDGFGNIIKKIFPDNFWEKYSYESQLKTYISQVSNKHLYNNKIEYDYKFGKTVQTLDINNMMTKFELDPLYGRIIKVWSPNEINALGSPPIIKIKYDPISNTGIAHSTVSHFAVDYDNNPVDTIITHTYIDGNKRVIQSKKTALISNNQGIEDNVNNWIGSGKIIYDALGRIVQQFNPIADNNENLNLDKTPNTLPTVTTYDILDRVLSITMPPSVTPYVSYKYGISENLLKVTSTLYNSNPALNVVSSDYFDGSENKVKSELTHNGKLIKTNYEYDGIHQLKKVIDDENHVTAKEYDLAGRIFQVTDPDGGKNNFEYDHVGNIIKKTLPDAKTISYLYNHDQLTDIIYPENPHNNVKYFYGKLGADTKTFGRVYYKEDATGAEKYEYDFFGNISKIEKTIIAPFDKLYTFNTEFKYDSWNRIHKIKYPDNSEIKYLYNKAGLLDNIIENDTKKYVSKIGYDEFEQRRYIKYGNGSESKYDYDDRRRLTNLNIAFTGGTSLNSYEYDNLNNIVKNSNNSNPGNGLNKSDVKNDYTYNDIGQLKTADGSWDPKTTYSIKPEYDSRLNLVTNNQLMKASGLISETNLSYKINDNSNRIDYVREFKNRSHIPSKNIDKYYVENNLYSYEYDEKGNNTVASTSDTDTKRKNINRRKILYDEDNRISAVNLNGFVSNYFYDDKGERIIKLSTQTDNIYVNGLLSAEKTSAQSFSLYVNPYFSTRNGMQDDSKYLYTKHIYIGSQRIASELAAITNTSQPVLCDQQISDKCSTEAANFPSKKGALENKVKETYIEFELHHQAIKTDEFKKKIPLIYKEEVNPNGSGMKIPIDNDAGLSYYYHTNQINSVNYVSDITGKAVQHIEYLPYGQVFIENRQGYSSQFTFTDKEEDLESGLTYFGARYYDSKVALWQSVDPMADKYPGLSPYNYCLGNPIMMVDPDGNSPGNPTKAPGYLIGTSEYYKFRNDDYNEYSCWNPWDRPPLEYYMDYGYKYAEKFSNELRPRLSEYGQNWLDKTKTNLQLRLENELQLNPSIELNSKKFKSMAYDTHVEAYWESGFTKMNFLDYVKIGLTPDFKDILTIDGGKQVLGIGGKLLNAGKSYTDEKINAAKKYFNEQN